MNRFAHIVCVLFLTCSWCQAQVEVTFPLGRFYRPGKYLPVRVKTDVAGDAPVVLRADGAVTVCVDRGPAGVDAVVPWLAFDDVRGPQWSVDGLGENVLDEFLTALVPDQVLVGAVGVDAAAVVRVLPAWFRANRVIVLPLVDGAPFRGDIIAWEALDAVVFDRSPREANVADLIQSGIAVVVTSDAPPSARWNWQGGPGRWWAGLPTAGPRGAVHPEAYAPTVGWAPGWPAPLRRRAVLMAAVFVIVALAATLSRRPWQAAAGVVVVAGVATCGFAWWGGRQPMMREASGVIRYEFSTGSQTDNWSYVRPLRSLNAFREWDAGHKPVFASAAQARDTGIRLRCRRTGRPMGFEWRVKAGTTLAFLSRAFSSGVPSAGMPARRPPLSPTGELARQAYLAPGDFILDDVGDAPPDDADDWRDAWPAVSVRRPSP